MILWKKWHTETCRLSGEPFLHDCCLAYEGPSVLDKIAAMPDGNPISVKELDLEFLRFSRSLEDTEEFLTALRLGPIYYAAAMGYKIVYSKADYVVVNA